jgi:hypothetical protein
MNVEPQKASSFNSIIQALDYVPFASSIKNFVQIVYKGVQKLLNHSPQQPEEDLSRHEIRWLSRDNPGVFRNVVLVVPFVGNIIVGVFDVMEKTSPDIDDDEYVPHPYVEAKPHIDVDEDLPTDQLPETHEETPQKEQCRPFREKYGLLDKNEKIKLGEWILGEDFDLAHEAAETFYDKDSLSALSFFEHHKNNIECAFQLVKRSATQEEYFKALDSYDVFFMKPTAIESFKKRNFYRELMQKIPMPPLVTEIAKATPAPPIITAIIVGDKSDSSKESST